MKRIAALAVVGVMGCAPAVTTLVEPDPGRTGAFGTDGPLGAVLVQRDLRVRGDRVVSVDIIAASDDGETFEQGLAPVLLVQGGSVPSSAITGWRNTSRPAAPSSSRPTSSPTSRSSIRPTPPTPSTAPAPPATTTETPSPA